MTFSPRNFCPVDRDERAHADDFDSDRDSELTELLLDMQEERKAQEAGYYE